MSEKNRNNKQPSVIVDWEQLTEEPKRDTSEYAGEHRIEDVRRAFEAQVMNVGGERVKYEVKLKEDLDALCHQQEERGLTNIETGETTYDKTIAGMKRFNMLVANGIPANVAYENVMNLTRSKFK